MLSFAGSLKIFIALDACDMRAGIHTLHALVAEKLKEDSRSGALFVFTNKRRKLIKVLYWDGSGMWLMTKRLERKDASHTEQSFVDSPLPLVSLRFMYHHQTIDPELAEPNDLEKALIGVNAKTGSYLMARSWSGGRRRIVGKGGYESYCYHVMSRTCGGEVFLDDVEKEALKRVMARLADFCGVKLLTYAVMGNHFHALIEVPRHSAWVERFSGVEGEERLFSHLRVLYSRNYVEALREQIAEWRRLGMESMVQLKLKAIKERFCDLSKYVKEVKERFSRWFNKRRGRRGTLWMDRFKSVMVESGGEALRTMAAYIDLNAVRAGLVEDPKDYRWCGYAEAVSGNRRAQRGLRKAVGKPVDGWESSGAREMYRCVLFDSGREVRDAQNVKVVRSGVKVEKTKEVLKAGGKLTLGELVRQRVRYFSDGLVLGSREFVDGIFNENRDKFGPKRKDGARRMSGVKSPLYSMRRLRLTGGSHTKPKVLA